MNEVPNTIPATAGRRHNCRRHPNCNIIVRITRPSIQLQSLTQKCTNDLCTAKEAEFETRQANECKECIQWCPCCGASKFTDSDRCAYNHQRHTWLQSIDQNGNRNICDQCQRVSRYCKGSRKNCRCNTEHLHHHCPTHHKIPNHQVTFTGSLKECDACRILKNDSMLYNTNERRKTLLTFQQRDVEGAQSRVLPKQSASFSERIDWHNALSRLEAIVRLLKTHHVQSLPLTNANMKEIYIKQSKHLGNNNKYGLESKEMVKRMFQWLLGDDEVIKVTCELKSLPWTDPRQPVQ